MSFLNKNYTRSAKDCGAIALCTGLFVVGHPDHAEKKGLYHRERKRGHYCTKKNTAFSNYLIQNQLFPGYATKIDCRTVSVILHEK